MAALLAFAASLDLGPAIGWSLAVNVALFAAMLGLGGLVTHVWRARPVVTPPPAVTRFELVIAAVTVLVNTGVMVAGWALFQRGVLHVDDTPRVSRWLLDLVVLTLVMDLAMYVLHRAAHHPIVYRWVHSLHHRYDQPRPLTLFVLHPGEVLGFGTLWIVVLCVYPASLGGMMLYLTLNSVFGTFGHVGVEPVPQVLTRLGLGTSTFHARHHQQPETNFGFYTVLWDRLFRSLGPRYDADFGKPPR